MTARKDETIDLGELERLARLADGGTWVIAVADAGVEAFFDACPPRVALSLIARAGDADAAERERDQLRARVAELERERDEARGHGREAERADVEPLEVTPVLPIGQRMIRNLLGDERYVPEYPPASIRRKITMRDLAKLIACNALGISAQQWNRLQDGSATCDFDEAERRLRAYAARMTTTESKAALKLQKGRE